MADGIRSTSELELSAIRVDEIIFFHLASVGGKIFVDVGKAEAGNGTSDQSCNVGMLLSLALALQLALHVVRAAAFAFGGGDEQVVARDGEGARIPLGGYKAHGIVGWVISNVDNARAHPFSRL